MPLQKTAADKRTKNASYPGEAMKGIRTPPPSQRQGKRK